jgi:hypothetical protein
MSLRPSARVEVRKKGYKLAVDADEARRKREEGMVEIRKSKREDSLLKKRREGMQQQQFSATVQTAALEKKVRSDVVLHFRFRGYVNLGRDRWSAILNSLTIVAVWTLISDWICRVDGRGVWDVRFV